MQARLHQNNPAWKPQGGDRRVLLYDKESNCHVQTAACCFGTKMSFLGGAGLLSGKGLASVCKALPAPQFDKQNPKQPKNVIRKFTCLFYMHIYLDLYIFIFHCVYVVCMYVYACSVCVRGCLCMWKPEVGIGESSSVALPRYSMRQGALVKPRAH